MGGLPAARKARRRLSPGKSTLCTFDISSMYAAFLQPPEIGVDSVCLSRRLGVDVGCYRLSGSAKPLNPKFGDSTNSVI